MDKLNLENPSPDIIGAVDSPAWNDCAWDDWEFYIPSCVQLLWPELSKETKIVAYTVADAIANSKADDHW